MLRRLKVLFVSAIVVLLAPLVHADSSRALRVGIPGEPQTLDPHRYNLNLEEKILADLFVGLTTVDEDGNIVPGVAESWSSSADGTVWSFKLRRNARWSDGQPVTAHDFVYGLQRLLDPETAASLAYFLYCVENAEGVNRGQNPLTELGVSATSDFELEIRLEQPFPFLPERLLYPVAYPVPRHVVDSVGDDWVKPDNWVSNGAYVLEEWSPQEHISLKKNPMFHDASSVAIHSVKYLPSAEVSTAYNRYLAEELDIIGDFPAGEVDALQDSRPDEVYISPLLSIMYIVFNVTQPPFDDVRVRQALGLAIDRKLITQRILKSGELPSFGMAPPFVDNHRSRVVSYEPDVDRARQLLTDAGYGSDRALSITLRYISGDESKRIHVAIADMWRQIGVRTTLHQADLRTHFGELRQGNFEVAQAGWFGENNPEHYLELLVSDIGDVNYGRFVSEQYDSLFDDVRQTADLDARVEILAEAEVVGLAEYPVIPLYSVMIRSLVNPSITGWKPNPRNTHNLRYLNWR